MEQFFEMYHDVSVPQNTLMWVLAMFAMLKSVSGFLNFVAVRTKNTWDNKLAKAVYVILRGARGVIDAFTANTRAKNEK